MIAAAYGNVYVAQIAMGADNPQTVKALAEAEAYPGPSLVIAYSHCIAHGIDMRTAMEQQKAAVDTGYWPLYRYDPGASREHPFHLDSRAPKLPLSRLHGEGGALRDARARASRRRRSAWRCWHRRTSTSAGTSTSRWRRSTTRPVTTRRRRRARDDHRPDAPATSASSWRARSWPPPRRSAATSRCCDASRTRARRRRAALAVRGADRARGVRGAPGARGRLRELRRGAQLLPRARRLQHRPRAVPRPPRRREGAAHDPRDREPERLVPGRLGALREADAGRRRRRARAERLLRRHRRLHELRAGRGALSRARARGARGGHDPARGQGRPLLQLDGQHGAAPGRRRRRRARPLQPLPAARHRPRDARASCRG